MFSVRCLVWWAYLFTLKDRIHPFICQSHACHPTVPDHSCKCSYSTSVLSSPTCDKFFITLFSWMSNQKYSSYVTLFPSLTFILGHQLLASMTEEKNILKGPHTVIRRVLKILWHQRVFQGSKQLSACSLGKMVHLLMTKISYSGVAVPFWVK